jgi:hypothetical protein
MTEKLNGINEVLNSLQLNVKAKKTQVNKFGNYKYRSAEDILAAVKEELKDEKYPANCVLITTVQLIELANRLFVQVKAILKVGKDEISAEGIAEHGQNKKGMDDAQLTGATITYARKYALQNLFGIDESEDDIDAKDNTKEGQPKTDKQKLSNIADQMAPEISQMKTDERARKDLDKTPEQKKAAAVKICNSYKAKIDASTSVEEIKFYFDDPEISVIMKSLEERQNELYKDLIDYKDGRIQILQTNINN